MAKIDVGKLTPDETEELFRECIQILPEITVMQVLKDVLTLEQIDELTESLP